jgi:hypothetical protein
VQVNAPIGSRRRAAITARDAAPRSTDQRVGTAKGHSKLESDPETTSTTIMPQSTPSAPAGHSNDGSDHKTTSLIADPGLSVVAVTPGADRGHRALVGQPLGVADGEILLAAPVRVMYQAIQPALPAPDGHLQGVQRQVGAKQPRGLPAHDEPGEASMTKAT